MITTLTIVSMLIAAYLIGSVCSAIVVCKLLRYPDPRTIGSNNPGATNVYRIAGAPAAATTLIFDVLKGTIPVYGGYKLGIEPIWLGFVGMAACLGHMYPLFHQFKGGKAVATALGAIGSAGWDLGGLLILTWAALLRLFGYASVASVLTVLLAPCYVYWLEPEYTVPVAMLSVLMVWRHHANLKRLIKGTEPKTLGKKEH